MEKKFGQKPIEEGIVADKETGLSPEEIKRFEEIRLRLDPGLGWKMFLNWDDFQNYYKYSSLNQKKELLEQRKAWFEAKNSGAKFGKYLSGYIQEQLELGEEPYYNLGAYLSLTSVDATRFVGELLGSDKMLAKKDGSAASRILDYLAAVRDKDAVDAIAKYIQGIYSDTYGRKVHRDSDCYEAVSSLGKILGKKTKDFLEQLAESSGGFLEWLGEKKAEFLFKENPIDEEGLQIDDFDEALEASRVVEIEREYEQLKIQPGSDFDKSSSEDEYWLAGYDDGYESESIPGHKQLKDISFVGLVGHKGSEMKEGPVFPEKPEKQIYPENLFPDYDIALGIGARSWETGKLVNFYGRFLSNIENPIAINAENYLSVLVSVASGQKENEEDVFSFISGLARPEAVQSELPEALSNEGAYRAAALAVSRALCLSGLEQKHDAAIAEVEIFKDYLNAAIQKTTERKSADFLLALSHELLKTQQDITAQGMNDKGEPKLPESAEAFLIYYHKFKRSREIPDFRVLLAEKIRHYLALDVFYNSEKINLTDEVEEDRLKLEGPSFGRLRSILGLYQKNIVLYAGVEKEDAPLYWEAKEKLENFDAPRNVVFGRDGRYFFTALKAIDFGTKSRDDLKYVVVTRRIQESVGREQVAAYLRQNGVSLDFTFIDTGFVGSIPEFAIRCLSESQGISLSREEIDRRIKLLSSAYPQRSQLFRKRSTHRAEDPVSTIENRPQRIDSPRYFKMDKHGRLKVEEVLNSVDEQLLAWTVEHSVMRNFAPRLDAEKRIKYLREDPLRGARFIQDFRSVSIGTHPMELWEEENGKKFLLKGGPDHTLRADFVGAKFLELVGVKTPKTEFISVEGQPKLKMDYLEEWKAGGIRLPEQYHQSEAIQAGFLVDLLLGQYDRTPWNLMFKEEGVAFIDNGGSLFSRARGGYKGFSDKLDVKELEELLKNPQFLGEPVNEAYCNLVEVRDGKIVVKDKERLQLLMVTFINKISDWQIEAIVDDAKFPDDRRSIARIEKILQKLGEDLNSLPPDSSDYQKTKEAIETLKKIIEAGGESTYLKKAIQSRYYDIRALFRPFLE